MTADELSAFSDGEEGFVAYDPEEGGDDYEDMLDPEGDDDCMCEWEDGCGGTGALQCSGCGGDQCVCICGGEMECPGCDECPDDDDYGDDVDEGDWGCP